MLCDNQCLRPSGFDRGYCGSTLWYFLGSSCSRANGLNFIDIIWRPHNLRSSSQGSAGNNQYVICLHMFATVGSHIKPYMLYQHINHFILQFSFMDIILIVFERTNDSHVIRIERPNDGPPMRILSIHTQPFWLSSGSGNTTWQIVVQEEHTPHPPMSLKSDTDHLLIYRNPTTETQTCWMDEKNGTWKMISEGAEHPFIPDRVLHFQSKDKDDPS